jgi:site-specific DNA-cytosine methylase
MYDNIWNVGTSGTPDASGRVNGFDMSFADLFWRVFNDLGYRLPNQNSEHVCYMFELMTKYNRVVVPHDKERLVLIGVRDKWGHEYHPDSIAKQYGYECVKEFSLQTVEQVRESFTVIDPLHQEGYVVVDNAFSRVKMKHPGYVALHHIKDSISPKKALEVVRVGESSEVLAHFPEWKEYFDIAQTALDDLKFHLETEYERIKDLSSQKEFALEACKTRLSGALFSLRANKVTSIAQYLAEMQIDTLAKILGIKTTDSIATYID